MTSLAETFACQVRAVARDREIPLSHVADRAGVARSHLWAVLKLERSPTLGLVERLAEALSVEPISLLVPGDQKGPERPSSRT